MSISELDILLPSTLYGVTPPKHTTNAETRLRKAVKAGHTIVRCPKCQGRAHEEAITVRRPGHPVVVRTVVRCWRGGTSAKPRCGLIIVSETPTGEVDDFPYSAHSKSRKDRHEDVNTTMAIVLPVVPPVDPTPPQKEFRGCQDCGADIRHMKHNAVRCGTCNTTYKVRYAKERYLQKRGPIPPRACSECGADISSLPNGSKRCFSCADAIRKRAAQEYEQRRLEKQRQAGPHSASRLCTDCGIDISLRGTSSTRCIACARVVKQAQKRIWSREFYRRKREGTTTTAD